MSSYTKDIFPEKDFVINGRENLEYDFSFTPKSPGNSDLKFYIELNKFKKELIGERTLLINRSINDFFALPINSFLITNPATYLYSSIIYLISLIA